MAHPKQFSMESVPQDPPRQPRRVSGWPFQEVYGGDDLFGPEDYRNGVDPIFGMTEAEFLGDVGDK